MCRVLVIGVGERLRGDDGVGPCLVDRLRADAPQVAALCVRGIDLLEAWAGADAVLLVDTVRSPDPAGTLHRFDASETALPAAGARSARGSTHAVGVGEAIELARTLGRLPAAVIVHGVTGERFELGAPLSAAVQEALPALAAAVRRDYDALGRR